MICTNCYYQGKGKGVTKGSLGVEVLLWLFLFWTIIIPLFYSIWRASSQQKVCPKCGQSTLVPENSPRGIELVQKYPEVKDKQTESNTRSEKSSGKRFSKWWLLLIFGVIVVVLIPYIALTHISYTPDTYAPTKQSTFVASVNFTSTQFVISNLDTHTCENARMQVNSDYELDGYTLESGLNSATKSGQVTVYKVGTGQFAKKDGTRFNPFLTKPQKFYIECRGNNEISGAYWYGSF